MKKITITLIALVFGFTNLIAQSPQTFKYQAVARDNLGKILVNQLVGLRISILKDSPLGATMYMETHTKGTNEFGIVTLNVGGGTAVTGNFNNINWSNGEYFIKTELDIAGTGTYIFIGSSQLLSVPFALHSEYATKAGKAMNDQDTSTTNELQTIVKTGNTITLSQNGGSVIDSDNQTLTLTDPTHITISGGNTIQLSAGLADMDADTTNELQNLSITGNTISISKGNTIQTDNDTTNEIQALSVNHNTLNILKSNSVIIDADTTNEIQALSRNGLNISLSKGGGTVNIADNDNDSTNELQVLSYSNDTLRLSNGNSVIVPLSQIVPQGYCINSTNPNAPSGYSYSGNNITNNWMLKASLTNDIGSLALVFLVNNKIYILGNSSGNNTYVYEFNPLTNTVTAKASQNFSLSYKTGTVCNNKIYIIGGSFSSNPSNEVHEYDPATNIWTTKAPMIVARYQNSLIVYNNLIYVIGGATNSSNTSVVEIFNPTTNSWSTGSPSPNSTIYPTAVLLNNKIYTLFNQIQEYDLQTNIWSVKNPYAQADKYSFVYNNKIYFIENYDLNEYDPATDIVTTKYSINQNVNYQSGSEFTATCINNKIFIIGGHVNTGVETTSLVQEYNIDTNTISLTSSLNYSRARHTSFVFNNKVYVFGGLNSQSLVVKIIEEFNPAVIYIHCKN